MKPMSVTATEAHKNLGRILDSVAGDQVVVITRYGVPQAVVMSLERFNALTGESRARVEQDEALLESLTAEFDAVLEKMQTPEAQRAARNFFRQP